MRITNYKYSAEVIEVFDGNTILANIDLGFNINHECVVHLFNPKGFLNGLGSAEKLIEILKSNNNQFVLEVEEFNTLDYGVIGNIYAGYTNVYPWFDSKTTRPVLLSVNEILLQDIKYL